MKKILFLLIAAFMLAACASGTSASINGTWKLDSYGSAFDQVPAAPGVDTSIEFGSDGRLSGTVGCNQFNGEYQVKGDKITFGPIASTRKFCEGSVGEQETTTLVVFIESAAFVIEGDILTLTSAGGSSVVVLAGK